MSKMKKLFTSYKYKLFLAKILKMVYNPYCLNIPTGSCPVQCDGFLKTGEWYYFRSRWSSWSLSIAKSEQDWFDDNLLFHYKENCFGEFEAGWISPLKSYILLNKGVKKYYSEKVNIKELN